MPKKSQERLRTSRIRSPGARKNNGPADSPTTSENFFKLRDADTLGRSVRHRHEAFPPQLSTLENTHDNNYAFENQHRRRQISPPRISAHSCPQGVSPHSQAEEDDSSSSRGGAQLVRSVEKNRNARFHSAKSLSQKNLKDRIQRSVSTVHIRSRRTSAKTRSVLFNNGKSRERTTHCQTRMTTDSKARERDTPRPKHDDEHGRRMYSAPLVQTSPHSTVTSNGSCAC